MLVADVAVFERLWHQAVEALVRAIDLLRLPQEFGAISSQYLPYVSILPAFAAVQAASSFRGEAAALRFCVFAKALPFAFEPLAQKHVFTLFRSYEKAIDSSQGRFAALRRI